MKTEEQNDKLYFFDCNCSIGRTGYPHLLDFPDPNGLRREMETAGVEEALVYHLLARDAHPPLGNKLLLDEIKDHPNLHPVWVLLPHHTGEMSPPKELLAEMKEKGVQAARLYPGRMNHSFTLADWCAGSLLGALAEARLPLLLDIEIVSWEEVFSLLQEYPQLPIILSNCSYRHNRFLYPLWERFDHLYIEMSRFMGGGGVEDVVRRFGSGRILFGTNMPHYTGTAAVARLTYADIPWRDKQSIAAENLQRILAEVWS
ncbi:MAG: amidohydrolase family protein [Candidatus Aminicenantales bacterium]